MWETRSRLDELSVRGYPAATGRHWAERDGVVGASAGVAGRTADLDGGRQRHRRRRGRRLLPGRDRDRVVGYRRRWLDADLPRSNEYPYLSGLPGLESLRGRAGRLSRTGGTPSRSAVADGARFAGRVVRGAGALRHDGPRQRLQTRDR